MNMLELPVSITNWIIIYDSLKCTTNRSLYAKIIRDYLDYLPCYKVDEICSLAGLKLAEPDFQVLMETLWKSCSLMGIQERSEINSIAVDLN